ncbi:MAG: NADPH-dependent FMN reductase [Gammaproteobacteria bacterium]
MKITAIIGSLRQNSIHRGIFESYKELAKQFFTLEEGVIRNIPLYNEDDGGNDIVHQLAEQIYHSDGVIFFSPEYNYSVPGVLKNAIDWLSRATPQPFSGKSASIIGASPGQIGTARMQYHLRQIGVYLNLHFLNKPEVMISGSNDKIKNGIINDESTLSFLKHHAEEFHKFTLGIGKT